MRKVIRQEEFPPWADLGAGGRACAPPEMKPSAAYLL